MSSRVFADSPPQTCRCGAALDQSQRAGRPRSYCGRRCARQAEEEARNADPARREAYLARRREELRARREAAKAAGRGREADTGPARERYEARVADAADGLLELRVARRRCEDSMRSLRIGLGLEVETVDPDPDPTPDGWTGYVSPQGWA